jgi:hypothetical protein
MTEPWRGEKGLRLKNVGDVDIHIGREDEAGDLVYLFTLTPGQEWPWPIPMDARLRGYTNNGEADLSMREET